MENGGWWTTLLLGRFLRRTVKLGGALCCTWMRMDCETKSPSCVTVGQTKAGACETTKLREVV